MNFNEKKSKILLNTEIIFTLFKNILNLILVGEHLFYIKQIENILSKNYSNKNSNIALLYQKESGRIIIFPENIMYSRIYNIDIL